MDAQLAVKFVMEDDGNHVRHRRLTDVRLKNEIERYRGVKCPKLTEKYQIRHV